MVTASLAAFCAVMTYLLVRSEYFPESSPLHRLPPAFVGERFLRHESSSALKVVWKGENVGSLNIRVAPGGLPSISGSGQLDIPILGRRPRLTFETDCRLKPDRHLRRLMLRGALDQVAFEVLADSETDSLRVSAHGPGVDEEREFRMSELERGGGKGVLANLQGLPPDAVRSPDQINAMTQTARLQAASTRIERLGEWMDAYMVEGRVDANSWVKLWMSPTGEILKLESSFGLTAINEDFFEGLSLPRRDAKKKPGTPPLLPMKSM